MFIYVHVLNVYLRKCFKTIVMEEIHQLDNSNNNYHSTADSKFVALLYVKWTSEHLKISKKFRVNTSWPKNWQLHSILFFQTPANIWVDKSIWCLENTLWWYAFGHTFQCHHKRIGNCTNFIRNNNPEAYALAKYAIQKIHFQNLKLLVSKKDH